MRKGSFDDYSGNIDSGESWWIWVGQRYEISGR